MIRAQTLAGPSRNGLVIVPYTYRGTRPDTGDPVRKRRIISRPCPTCDCPPGSKCVTADGRISNSYHKARRTVTA